MVLAFLAGYKLTTHHKELVWLASNTRVAGVYFGLIILLGFAVLLLRYFHDKYIWNYIFLILFILVVAMFIGTTCTLGKPILVAVGLNVVSMTGLSLYMLFIARKVEILSLWLPYILSVILVAMVTFIIEIVCPLYKLNIMMEGCAIAIVWTGYIVLGSSTIIKILYFGEHVWGVAALHFEVVHIITTVTAYFQRSSNQ